MARYLLGTLSEDLETKIATEAYKDALTAINEGATSPWGDGETYGSIRELLLHLEIKADPESDEAVTIGEAYDRFFREAIDQLAPPPKGTTMNAKPFSSRVDAVSYIEELLGPDGSRDLAEAILKTDRVGPWKNCAGVIRAMDEKTWAEVIREGEAMLCAIKIPAPKAEDTKRDVPDGDHAKASAKATLASILEMVAKLKAAEEADDDDAREEAETAIHEDPLSVLVRDGWREPGAKSNGPEEFEILLSTGGPATRLVGSLNAHNEPDGVELQYQDWGTPWTEYAPTTEEEREALMSYAQCFYFGE